MQVMLAFPDVHGENSLQLDMQEVGVDLSGNRPGEKRLAAARRAVQQQTASGRLPEGLEHFRLLKRQNKVQADFFFNSSIPPTS